MSVTYNLNIYTVDIANSVTDAAALNRVQTGNLMLRILAANLPWL